MPPTAHQGATYSPILVRDKQDHCTGLRGARRCLCIRCAVSAVPGGALQCCAVLSGLSCAVLCYALLRVSAGPRGDACFANLASVVFMCAADRWQA
jgi:hypothetical protein